MQLLQIVVLTTRRELTQLCAGLALSTKTTHDANLEAQSQSKMPTWRPKAGPGGEVGGPKLVQEPNLEALLGRIQITLGRFQKTLRRFQKTWTLRRPKKPTWTPQDPPGGQLGGRKASQEADLGGKGRPRTPTWSQNATKRVQNGAKRLQK